MVLIYLVHLQSQLKITPRCFMLGLGRLFADDTSIGHTAHDETTLKNMINIDLKYLQEWSIQSFIKIR
jgi:hypothetical protein